MESQNHFYGHSAALARYVGRNRPRHVRGLIQHGWTALSPVATHFRDFPHLGLEDGDSRLLVWSHTSRAWDPAAERHHTTPIAAPFVYLAAASGPLPQPRDERDEVVLMPVHGIQTQRVRGDHAGLAKLWREQEGEATVCLYAADAEDPEIAGAYAAAGHRLVVLGDRMDPAFLWRLWTMVGRARRVVSNRLSTPVVYAAHLGVDVGVYGDALRIDGEGVADNDRVRELWPELHGAAIDPATAKALSDAELGVGHLRPPHELEDLLGWNRAPVGSAVSYWSTSPARRAVVNLRRRAGSPSPSPSEAAPSSLSFAAWFRAAMSYLPQRLPRQIPQAGETREPVPVSAAGP
jgi:hypothetical protein